MMDTNNLLFWFKSLRNSFVGSESPNYFTLVPHNDEITTNTTTTITTTTYDMENTSDRNNNTELNNIDNVSKKMLNDDLILRNLTHNHSSNIETNNNHSLNMIISTSNNIISNKNSNSNTTHKVIPISQLTKTNDETKSFKDSPTITTTAIEPLEAKMLNNDNVVNNGTFSAPCCDIIKYKNELYHDIMIKSNLSLLINANTTSSQTIKNGQKVVASKIIQVMIDAVKSHHVLTRLEPFILNSMKSFPINAFGIHNQIN